ncbi:MAG: SDR family oxidoreductase [Actinomycetota bacterium]|nr:SDR family oxidoreductase [Actinomycetota bacterium]
MKILITGNMGYLGPAVVRRLRASRPDASIIGLDSGFFASCLAGNEFLPECMIDYQCFADIRNFPHKVLDGVDVVIHLAAVPGGPESPLIEDVTFEINYLATIDLALEARRRGVGAFVYASSCSIYGFSADGKKMMEYATPNPLTACAKAKVFSERQLERLAGPGFKVTSLRFPAACGMSERLRLDLVLNNLVACAFSTGEISVPGDGDAWKPLINIRDMARAIDWAASRDVYQGGHFLAINAGSNDCNYRMMDIALAVGEEIPGVKIYVDKSAPPEMNSFAVDFSLFKKLAPDHQPESGLRFTIRELKSGIENMAFAGLIASASRFNRFKMIEELMSKGMLTPKLLWPVRTNAGPENKTVPDGGDYCLGYR